MTVSNVPVEEGAYLLDVRSPVEFEDGSIPGAVNIPLDMLRARLAELPDDRTILIFCKIGLRGYIASRILTAHGFTMCVNLSGGYETYNTSLPIP